MLRALLLAVAALLAAPASAATTGSHAATLTISAIDELAITGGSVSLSITSSAPATSSATSVSWTTNAASRKVTVATSLATIRFPLTVAPTAVTGGKGSATLTLGTTAQDLVTGISNTYGSCTLGYSATATSAAGSGTDTHTVTFTLTAA